MSQSISVAASTAAAQAAPGAANAGATGTVGPTGDLNAIFVQMVLTLLNGAGSPQSGEEKPAHDGKTLPHALPAETANVADPVAALMTLVQGTAVEQPAAADAGAKPQADADTNTESAAAVGDATSRSLGARLALNLADQATVNDKAPQTDTHAKDESPVDVLAKAVAAITPDKLITKAITDAAAPVTTVPASHTSASQHDASPNTVATAVAATPVADAAPAAAKTAAAAAVPVAIQQHGFEDALGDRVVWLTNAKIHSAEIQVTPPDLGPIEVHIQVSNDQASISFGASHQLARDAIESAIPRLREMLGQQGLNLTDVNVSQHSFADRRDDSGYLGGRASSDSDGAVGSVAVTTRATRGMVDLYA
jgi:flagellar hook-length control protein FliK